MKTQPRKSLRYVLHNGDCLTQADFHAAYEAMPENYRAELIGGIVFEPSPLGLTHGTSDARLGYILEHYAAHTKGLQVAHNATVIMSDQDEVQPDVLLRIMPQHGGQSKNTNKKQVYVAGAPELVAEIAHSSRAIDLHLKKERYAGAGVLEYIVVCLEPERFLWFNLRSNRELSADKDGVFRSGVFPGLWIHGDALLQLDYHLSMKVLNQGLETSEYQEFAAKLAQAN